VAPGVTGRRRRAAVYVVVPQHPLVIAGGAVCAFVGTAFPARVVSRVKTRRSGGGFGGEAVRRRAWWRGAPGF